MPLASTIVLRNRHDFGRSLQHARSVCPPALAQYSLMCDRHSGRDLRPAEPHAGALHGELGVEARNGHERGTMLKHAGSNDTAAFCAMKPDTVFMRLRVRGECVECVECVKRDGGGVESKRKTKNEGWTKRSELANVYEYVCSKRE